jgi:hypothetical protein
MPEPIKKLPTKFIEHMNATVQLETDGKTPIEVISEERKKQGLGTPNLAMPRPIPPPPTAAKEAGRKEVDGFMLPDDTQVMFLYRIAKLALEDEKVNALLTEFNFTLKDLAGKQIYPKAK